ncbi:MAG TPA: alpha/beta hydrolase [Acidimicrobiales bacterium]|nr:alpha/beta hydrolase [Acidimicrobiales bacterium]
MTQRVVAVGQRLLWAERMGSPDLPTALLLAGAAMQAITWEPCFVEPILHSGRSVIRFDWRDIGLSSWVRFQDLPYSIDDLASDCLAVLDAFGVEIADLVGFSMGGCVAQLVALSAPERVRSLTLLSPGFASKIKADRGELGHKLLALLAEPNPDDQEAQVRRQVEQWRLLCGGAFHFEPTEWEDRARSWLERGQNLSCPHLRLGPEVFGVDRSEQLCRLAVRTQIFHGDDDPMFPLAHGLAIAQAVPQATISIYAGRGHDLHLDREVAESVIHGISSPST